MQITFAGLYPSHVASGHFDLLVQQQIASGCKCRRIVAVPPTIPASETQTNECNGNRFLTLAILFTNRPTRQKKKATD